MINLKTKCYHTHTKRPTLQCGFTLLEVLVAMAVLALALGAVIKVGSQNISNTAYLRDRTYAHWVALNEMTQYRIALKTPQEGVQRGTSEMAGRQWYWSTNIEIRQQMIDDENYVELWRIEVSVRDQNHAAHSPLATTIAYLPL